MVLFHVILLCGYNLNILLLTLRYIDLVSFSNFGCWLNKILELWTKRNFRCDCGNSKFGEFFCKLDASKDVENTKNSYNHNFKGSYCTCGRPYPDPDVEDQLENLQCCICEDWFHEEHLGLESSDMVGNSCFFLLNFCWSSSIPLHFVWDNLMIYEVSRSKFEIFQGS